MAEQRDQRAGAERDPIQERLLDQGETGQEEIVGAAQESFEEDQRDPSHPTRIKRELTEGVQDPAHSRGSTRQGPGARDLGQD